MVENKSKFREEVTGCIIGLRYATKSFFILGVKLYSKNILSRSSNGSECYLNETSMILQLWWLSRLILIYGM